MMIFKNILFLLLLGIVGYEDYKSYKVSNKNVLWGIFLGLICMFLTKGFDGLRAALAGSVVSLLIGFLFWKIKVFKAGDGKLFWMIGTFEGFNDMWMTMAAAIIAGGIASIIILLKNHALKERLLRVWLYLESLFLGRKFESYKTVENDSLKLPFAAACFAGILIYKLCKGIVVFLQRGISV